MLKLPDLKDLKKEAVLWVVPTYVAAYFHQQVARMECNGIRESLDSTMLHRGYAARID